MGQGEKPSPLVEYFENFVLPFRQLAVLLLLENCFPHELFSSHDPDLLLQHPGL